jgi:citrate synthase
MSDSIVIASAARTAVGSFNGAFAATPAHELGAVVIRELLSRAGVEAAEVDEVILGQVLTAAQGQNPARQASIIAGLPKETTAWGLNQVCGSGLRAIALGMQQIATGDAKVIIAGGQESMSLSPHAEHLRAEAAGLLESVADILAGPPPLGSIDPIHLRLARAWGSGPAEADLIRRALVLLADHELNASTFAARVAASTGAPIAACLLAGLATLSGPRHGGAGAAAIALVEDAERLGPDEAIARWLAHDRPLPGFGHPLYPEGDPRAEGLFADFRIDDSLARLRKSVLAATGLHPNIDFALAAMTRSLRLPADAPFRLFALGRSVGWTAHAIEQVTSNRLIRPRARYDGPVERER